MKLDQSVCLILGATLAVKTIRRLTVTCQATWYIYSYCEIQKSRKNVMAPLQAKGL